MAFFSRRKLLIFDSYLKIKHSVSEMNISITKAYHLKSKKNNVIIIKQILYIYFFKENDRSLNICNIEKTGDSYSIYRSVYFLNILFCYVTLSTNILPRGPPWSLLESLFTTSNSVLSSSSFSSKDFLNRKRCINFFNKKWILQFMETIWFSLGSWALKFLSLCHHIQQPIAFHVWEPRSITNYHPH